MIFDSDVSLHRSVEREIAMAMYVAALEIDVVKDSVEGQLDVRETP